MRTVSRTCGRHLNGAASVCCESVDHYVASTPAKLRVGRAGQSEKQGEDYRLRVVEERAQNMPRRDVNSDESAFPCSMREYHQPCILKAAMFESIQRMDLFIQSKPTGRVKWNSYAMSPVRRPLHNGPMVIERWQASAVGGTPVLVGARKHDVGRRA